MIKKRKTVSSSFEYSLAASNLMRAALPVSPRRIVEFSTSDFTMTFDHDLIDTWRVQWEGSFYTYAISTRRTVKGSRMPPLILMTTPSKTWIRSRVPSTTFTCTCTVSPGRKAGYRFFSCLFQNINNIAHISSLFVSRSFPAGTILQAAEDHFINSLEL